MPAIPQLTETIAVKLAPFHVLATEGEVHTDKDHEWHMKTIQSICESGEQLMVATPYKLVDLNKESQIKGVIDW